MKNYVKPMMESEVFAANEYIAACGDSGVIYNFECNAGDWWGGYSVYLNVQTGNRIPVMIFSGAEALVLLEEIELIQNVERHTAQKITMISFQDI